MSLLATELTTESSVAKLVSNTSRWPNC